MSRRGHWGWRLWKVVVGVGAIFQFRDDLTDHNLVGASVYALLGLVGIALLAGSIWGRLRSKGSEVGSPAGGQVIPGHD